jgi:hypothetical protein
MNNLQQVLLEPAKVVLVQAGNFFMGVLLVVVLLLLGWIITKVVRAAVVRALKVLKVDDVSDRFELDALLEKGGITYTLSELIGVVVYWIGMLVTVMVAVNAVNLIQVAALLDKVILYIPNVISALFILIVGIFVATLLKNIVQTAVTNAGIAQAKILSKFVESIVIVFAVIVSLEQLNIGVRITELTLAIILGSIGLGLALAFGLGCKDIAGKAVNEFIEKLKKK